MQAALEAAGVGAEPAGKTAGLGGIFYGMGDGLAEWTVTAPGGRQMSCFDRGRQPVIMEFGPVLDLADVVAGKVCALCSRFYPRDYLDTAAAMTRYSISELIELATRMDPGLTRRDITDAGLQLSLNTNPPRPRWYQRACEVGAKRRA